VGELAPERAWPVARFNETIARFLAENPGKHAVLTGKGAAEKAVSAQVHRASRLLDLTDQLSLTELIATVAGASAAVTADTSLLHLALLTGTPVVGLFGPTLPTTYFPTGRGNAVAVFEGLYCSPCIHHWHFTPCRGNNQCMQTIGAGKVRDALATVLATPRGGGAESSYALGSDPYYPGLIYDKDRG
jgi:ADP-heptose:LPS heptosyltransferase